MVPTRFFMPAEWTRHARTVVAWPSLRNTTFITPASLHAATDEVSRIAEAVARFEPVTLVVTQERAAEARKRFSHPSPPSAFSSRQGQGGHEVRVHPVNNRDDNGGGLNLWMRDIAPVFAAGRRAGDEGSGGTSGRPSRLRGIDFNFNGWGGRHSTATCSALAETLLLDAGTERVRSSLVTEGGAIEVDGEGTLLATESSIVNPNRNPGMTRGDIEDELGRQLGVSRIIWLPGIKDAESTDCHVDALARFTPEPGVVLLSRPVGLRETVWMRVYEEARAVLEREKLRVVDVPEPDLSRLEEPLDEEALKLGYQDHTWLPVMSYVNYYLPNGGVIVPQFGDKAADAMAMAVLAEVFSRERTLVPVYIRELPVQGGGIHCATQQVPFHDTQ